jgi:hypothetical protein
MCQGRWGAAGWWKPLALSYYQTFLDALTARRRVAPARSYSPTLIGQPPIALQAIGLIEGDDPFAFFRQQLLITRYPPMVLVDRAVALTPTAIALPVQSQCLETRFSSFYCLTKHSTLV